MPSSLRALVSVKRIAYPRQAFEPGQWAVAVCDVQEVYEGEPYAPEIVVKGTFYSLDAGGLYTLTGELQEHPQYGRSYRAVAFARAFDAESPHFRRMFLESLYTPSQVKSLYNALPDPFGAIQSGDVASLCKAKGIGVKTAERMVKTFHDDYDKSRAYVELGQYGLPVPAVNSLIRRFHGDIERLLATVAANPYLMMEDVDGIGWVRADRIARAKGVQVNDPIRVRAGTLHLLNKATDEGHTWVSPQWLAQGVLELLGLDPGALDIFREGLYFLHEKEKLWWDESKTRIALARVRRIEEDIATELRRIASGRRLLPRTGVPVDESLARLEAEQGWAFTLEQREAIQLVLDNNVAIITGGAGVGKSSTVGGVLRALGNVTFAQCALSGRAAARLTEVTHKEGMTIHRLLGANGGGHFTFDEESPLGYDIVILDETSMVGAEIFLCLLRAIPTGGKLIMLGDDGQLESIGLCNVFKDMLDSGVVPVYRLTQIHRQAARSAIITESVKVRNCQDLIEHGWVGHEVRGELQDLELNIYNDSILSQDTIMQSYHDLLAQGVPPDDIQVVVPTRQRGAICVNTLNPIIQTLVNPHSPELDEITVKGGGKNASYTLRQNDRVIVTKNMYHALRYTEDFSSGADAAKNEISVFNGDRGRVKAFVEGGMVVTFDQWGDVLFKSDQYHNIELGYALSCHKLQGSEADYVIVGFDFSGMVLLSREWLYTAITRARRHCVICAETGAVSYACHQSSVSQKQTMLKELLQEAFNDE